MVLHVHPGEALEVAARMPGPLGPSQMGNLIVTSGEADLPIIIDGRDTGATTGHGPVALPAGWHSFQVVQGGGRTRPIHVWIPGGGNGGTGVPRD
jgi:hypothetical protein